MFDLPRHGSLVSRNSSNVTQPPPTRTITVLFKNRTNRIFCFSPNYSTRNEAHSIEYYVKYFTSVKKRQQIPKHAHKHQEEKVHVFTSCPTRYRMNLFLEYSLSFTWQPLIRKECNRNIRHSDCHRAKILEYYTNLIPIKKGCGQFYPVFALLDHLGTE